MKKFTIAAAAAVLAFSSSAFAEVTFNAYNKLFSDMTLVEKSTYKIGSLEEEDESKVFQGVLQTASMQKSLLIRLMQWLRLMFLSDTRMEVKMTTVLNGMVL
ncbi:hypothetical protein HNP77_000045 [Treponema rectale]|uniref:Uncharacterized protein n=1 Tax=Treponema rectale TaxID=744512 RepID=A0A840SE30_9SPIR|nr:hypothetical protein [Treponema rectale]MBB5217701.1 hypothetical protein [Treponema rectale]